MVKSLGLKMLHLFQDACICTWVPLSHWNWAPNLLWRRILSLLNITYSETFHIDEEFNRILKFIINSVLTFSWSVSFLGNEQSTLFSITLQSVPWPLFQAGGNEPTVSTKCFLNRFVSRLHMGKLGQLDTYIWLKIAIIKNVSYEVWGFPCCQGHLEAYFQQVLQI